jgi:hypothetical protein
MINGLQVKVPGSHLILFATERVKWHRDRASYYNNQVKVLADAGIGIENSHVTSNDPKSGAMSKEKEHITAAEELEFMILYFDAGETYVLSQVDLQKLGKVSRGY